MIAFGVRRLFLCGAVTDMRKSFDSLACLVQHHLQHDPLSGDAFVFMGRDKKRLKVLWWDTAQPSRNHMFIIVLVGLFAFAAGTVR